MRKFSRRRALIFAGAAALAIAVLLTACAKESSTGDEKVYKIYYINEGEDQVKETDFTPVSDSFDGILTELLYELKTPPAGKKLKSALPEGVEVNGYQMGIDELTLDFNAAYLSMTNTREVLLRCCYVQTLLKLPDVVRVRFTVDGQTLSGRDGEEIGPMGPSTFVLAENGINSYQYETLGLYFPNEDGSLVSREMRNIYYSSNLVTQQLVVEQIIQGPVNSRLTPVALQSVKINDVSISDDTCVVDLDETFNTVPPGCRADAETCLYAFVNTLCDTCDVEKVRFKINGRSDVRFRGEISLDEDFERNAEIIEPSGSAEIFGGVVVSDDTGTGGELYESEKEEDDGDGGKGQSDAAAGLGIDPSIAGTGGEN